MHAAGLLVPASVARAYFAVQAAGGAVWWIAVFTSSDVQRWTLGGWDPAILVGPDLLLFVGASAWSAVRGSTTAAAMASVWTTSVTLALGGYGFLEQEAGAGVVLMAVATVGTLTATAVLWFGHVPTRWFFVGPFSFRVAQDAPPASHLRHSLAQLVVFWTVFFLLIPLVLAAVEERLRLSAPALDQRTLAVVGVAIFTMASGVGLWSCVTMAVRGHGTPLPAATARHLVISGPYRWMRNPMAFAGALQTVGVGLIVGSWMVIAIAFGGAIAWHTAIRPVEEGDLAERFGEPYERYREQVRCWIPTRPRHTM